MVADKEFDGDCYTESYSRSIAPRATPGLLSSSRLVAVALGSSSRLVAPGVAFGSSYQNGLRCIQNVTSTRHDASCHSRLHTRLEPRATCSVEPRATPSQLHRELLPVCCTESYSVTLGGATPKSYSKTPLHRAYPPQPPVVEKSL